MLYRRRMERQLAQARGLMSGEGKMPPPEDDVSHLHIQWHLAPFPYLLFRAVRGAHVSSSCRWPSAFLKSNLITKKDDNIRAPENIVTAACAQRRRRDDLQNVIWALSGAAMHVGR